MNKKLNKPLFVCDASALDARWKDGGDGCSFQWQEDDDDEEEEEEEIAGNESNIESKSEVNVSVPGQSV